MFVQGLSGIPSDWIPVVPSDTENNCGAYCVVIRPGTAGTVAFLTRGSGDTPRSVSLAAGEPFPGQITRVLSNGTTATDILAGQA